MAPVLCQFIKFTSSETLVATSVKFPSDSSETFHMDLWIFRVWQIRRRNYELICIVVKSDQFNVIYTDWFFSLELVFGEQWQPLHFSLTFPSGASSLQFSSLLIIVNFIYLELGNQKLIYVIYFFHWFDHKLHKDNKFNLSALHFKYHRFLWVGYTLLSKSRTIKSY